jgi:hypothetical protein
MKRIFAAVALMAALGILSKLAFKPQRDVTDRASTSTSVSTADRSRSPGETVIDPESALLGRYPRESAEDRAMIARVADKFRQTALAIDRTDGLRGLRLLDRLDLEAVYLYEKHPKEFRRLRETLTDEAAADLLIHWREYFGLKRADDTDRGILVAELAQLSPSQRRLASTYPSALPLILADPSAVSELIDHDREDEAAVRETLLILSLISLEHGAADIRAGVRTIENHRWLALEAFRQHGPEGFALVSLYGSILDAVGTALPLDQSLILLRVNSDYVDELLQTHRPETVASHLGHVAAHGLVEAVGGSTNGLRLMVEYGEKGERALARAGSDAADVVFGDFADPTLRGRAVEALGEHGSMALVILDKYATDPDFRDVLRIHGAASIPPIAQADASPEVLAFLQSKDHRTLAESLAKIALLTSGDNGQAVIRLIKKDGLERVAYLNSSSIQFYQFLPLYDLLHLGNVLCKGQTPTSGEMTWALVDGCFVVMDALALTALQPEGAVAAELVRSEAKSATRQGARTVGRELAEAGSEGVSRQLSRWFAVRSAGGVFQVLRRFPEALPRMSLAQIVSMARPLCAKAGIRLSAWRPFQLLREGLSLPFRIPPERGLKYIAAQVAQASVGVVGFQKMEEHLASRRPRRT